MGTPMVVPDGSARQLRDAYADYYIAREDDDPPEDDRGQIAPHESSHHYSDNGGWIQHNHRQEMAHQSPSVPPNAYHNGFPPPAYPGSHNSHQWGSGPQPHSGDFAQQYLPIHVPYPESNASMGYAVPESGFPPQQPHPEPPMMPPHLHEGQPVDYYHQYPYHPSFAASNVQEMYGSYPNAGYHPGYPAYGAMEQFQQETKSIMEEPSSAQKRRRAKTFPEKLMRAFTDFPNEDAVAWLPDGKSFVVVNQDLFVSEVLNRVFKASKYASFIRKLHRWGYVRLTSGTGTDCFHHPLFTINNPELSAHITCATPEHRKAVLVKNAKNKPSLAGVERFIRAKVAAMAAKHMTGVGPSPSVPKNGPGKATLTVPESSHDDRSNNELEAIDAIANVKTEDEKQDQNFEEFSCDQSDGETVEKGSALMTHGVKGEF